MTTSRTTNLQISIFCYFDKDGKEISIVQKYDEIFVPFSTKGSLSASSIWRVIPLFDTPESELPAPVITSINSLCRDCEHRIRNPELYGRFYKEIAHTKVSLKINYAGREQVSTDLRFGSRAVYSLIIKENNSLIFIEEVEASAYYLPLWLSLAFLFLVWLGKQLFKSVNTGKSETKKVRRRSEDFMEDIVDLKKSKKW